MTRRAVKRVDAILDQIEAADLAYHEARVKELKARKAYHAAEKIVDGARQKLCELQEEYRRAQAAEIDSSEGGAS